MSALDRGQRGNQTYRWQRLPCESSLLPLDIPFAVHSTWVAGDYHEREQSTEFWIELVTAGEILFIQDSKNYLVKPDAIYLPRPGCTHRFTTGPCGFAHKRSVCMQGVMLGPVLACTGLDKCDTIKLADPIERLNIIRLFKRCDHLLEQKPLGFAVDLAMTGLGLLIRLGECVRHAHSSPINRALHFMRQNISRQVSDREMAAAAGLSVTHFHRLFKAEMKNTPKQHFLELKAEHAKGILTMTDLSIKEIAYSLGYDEPAYFTDVFKRVTELSPSEYRKKGVP